MKRRPESVPFWFVILQGICPKETVLGKLEKVVDVEAQGASRHYLFREFGAVEVFDREEVHPWLRRPAEHSPFAKALLRGLEADEPTRTIPPSSDPVAPEEPRGRTRRARSAP